MGPLTLMASCHVKHKGATPAASFTKLCQLTYSEVRCFACKYTIHFKSQLHTKNYLHKIVKLTKPFHSMTFKNNDIYASYIIYTSNARVSGTLEWSFESCVRTVQKHTGFIVNTFLQLENKHLKRRFPEKGDVKQ